MLQALCALSLVLLPVHAQEESSTLLTLDESITRTLEEGGSDRYRIEASEGQFVAGRAIQHSVDVVVRVLDPEGKLVAEFDGPAAGPEQFSFETQVAGAYEIEVAAFEKDTGQYELDLLLHELVAKAGPQRADQLMAAYSGKGTPGGSLVVVRDGEVVFEKAYGMANLVHSIPFEPETPSNLGSTSKQFTAFAILLLESQGKLSIDDEVRKHIPELPEFDAAVTIRHLLTHTSGYREFLNTLGMGGRRLDEGDFIDREELIEIVQRQPELQNSPGSEFNYNNTGFGLLTVIVERVTNEDFPGWMKANVFEPLQMNSSYVRAHPSQLIPGSSQGYSTSAEGFRNSRDLGGAMGAGAIYSTTGDMAKWIHNLQTGELGGKELVERMATPFTLTNGESTGYGFGLFIDEQRGLQRIQHGGADSAHRAMLMFFPEIAGGVVALSNNSNFNSSQVASELAEAFFADEMKPESKPVEASAEITEAALSFDPAGYDPASFDELVGRYELDAAPGFVLEFRREEEKLITQATGQQAIEIKPIAELRFKIVGVEAEVAFHREEDGGVRTLTLHQNGEHKAQRLTEKAWEPDEEELAKYCGRYFSGELETIYTFVVVEGELTFQHRRLNDATLAPGKQHEFTSPSGQVRFEVDGAGLTTGFVASTGRTRDVRFERMP